MHISCTSCYTRKHQFHHFRPGAAAAAAKALAALSACPPAARPLVASQFNTESRRVGFVTRRFFRPPLSVTQSFSYISYGAVRECCSQCCKQLDRKEQTKLNHIKQTVSLSQHTASVALRCVVAKSADKTALCARLALNAPNFRPGDATDASFHCSGSYSRKHTQRE